MYRPPLPTGAGLQRFDSAAPAARQLIKRLQSTLDQHGGGDHAAHRQAVINDQQCSHGGHGNLQHHAQPFGKTGKAAGPLRRITGHRQGGKLRA